MKTRKEEKNLPVSITETYTPPSAANRLRCFRKRQLTSQQEQGCSEKHILNGSTLGDKQRILKSKLTLWPSHSCKPNPNIINTKLKNRQYCKSVHAKENLHRTRFFFSLTPLFPPPEISPSCFTIFFFHISWSYFSVWQKGIHNLPGLHKKV